MHHGAFIEPPSSSQRNGSRVPKLHDFHVPFPRFPLCRSKQRCNRWQCRRRPSFRNAWLGGGSEVLRAGGQAVFDDEAEYVQRVAVVVVRIRPHTSPNAPGSLPWCRADDGAFDLGVAGEDFFCDKVFARVVPGHGRFVWDEGYGGACGFGEVVSKGLFVGFAKVG